MTYNMWRAVAVLLAAMLSTYADEAWCGQVQFMFGDSLIDVGNNEYLTRSIARAALPWYGVDLGIGLPNGRFTNGRTVADILGDKAGLPRPPPFLDPSLDVDTILKMGVSYASGGAGILNDTGALFNQRLSFYKQIELFQGTQKFVAMKIGDKAGKKFFGDAQYVVALGSNDFINNYLIPLYGSSWRYTDSSFIGHLMTTLDSQFRLLYRLGARHFLFVGLGPMGCIPLQRTITSSGGCQERTNELCKVFNKAASVLVSRLSSTLANITIRYSDPYTTVLDIINNPLKYGLNNSADPCCSLGNIRPALICTPLSTLCPDRSKYVFWDDYHPTDKANQIIADELSVQLGFNSKP